MKKLLIISGLVLGSAFFTLCDAQYTILHSFTSSSPDNGQGSLTLAGNKLYGISSEGGTQSRGFIFSIDTNGNGYKDLFDFNGTDGEYPYGSLILSGKNLYGVAFGGAFSTGVIFCIDTNGNGYRDLFDFNSANEQRPPFGSLALAGNKLYGLSNQSGRYFDGNIFSIDTNGSGYEDLYDFSSGSFNSALTFANNNKIYWGMPSNDGSIYSLDTNGGRDTDLFDFNNTNGFLPYGYLMFSGKALYGYTAAGGQYNEGVIFSIDTNGQGFKNLLGINNSSGQEQPTGALILLGNKLYGMTMNGGANDSGSIFSIDSGGGGYADIFDFNGANGKSPSGSLSVSGNVLYGMTANGGANDMGVIFKFRYDAIASSVSEIASREKIINIYPNPNDGVFNIGISGKEQGISEMQIEIYNVLGEQVYYTLLLQTSEGALNEIDLSNQPNGVYLYRVISENGSLVGSGKLIIQK